MSTEHSFLLSFNARSAEETEQLAFLMSDVIRSRPSSARDAIVVALTGELGAGKTAFARGLGAGFGVSDSQVSSPTFTLRMDHVVTRSEGRAEELFAHLDCWRMEPRALESVGFASLLQEPRALIAIEWPQRIASVLPVSRIDVTLVHTFDDGDAETIESRRVHLDCSGLARTDRPLAVRIVDALRLLALAPVVSTLTCARCAAAPVQDAFAPFCCARCRLLDLGDWLRGSYVIEGEPSSGADVSGEIA